MFTLSRLTNPADGSLEPSTTAVSVLRRRSAASFAFAVRAAVASRAVRASVGSEAPGRLWTPEAPVRANNAIIIPSDAASHGRGGSVCPLSHRAGLQRAG